LVRNTAMIPACKRAAVFSALLAAAAGAQIPPQPSILSSGPYLQYATKTGITILWETGQKASSVLQRRDILFSKQAF